MAAMNGHLITADGRTHEPTVEEVKALLAASTPFWLDLAAPVPDETAAYLRDVFGFHPLAVEDSAKFGQRPKIDAYDDFTLLVVYGVNLEGRIVEVHCFYTRTFLVTIHHDVCPAIGELCDRLIKGSPGRRDHIMLLYRVVDALVDGYFPLLGDMDDHIDDLEDRILIRPTEQQLGELFDLKRQLIALRKVVTPQRDMFASLLTGSDAIPDMTPEAERYFRDLYDHLIRISDLVDSYRDLLSGALDTHLSTVSNRLNVVMKQLTIIATVFLPATFLTGFFGQNFGWMVDHLSSFGVFISLGVVCQLVLAAILLTLFRQRGWLTSDASPLARRSDWVRTRPKMLRSHRWSTVHPHAVGPEDGGAGREPAAVGSGPAGGEP
jgi:magnesium transporter